jgi:3-oxo-5-alpha-steroid 4-dehydrogenase 1
MTIIDTVAIVWTLLALVLFPMQFFVTAPYGRHARTDWGPSIPNRLGWFLMELVSLVVFAGLFLFGPAAKTAPMWVFFALWTAHYVNRSLIFPLRTRTAGKSMPLAIAGSAAAFNIVNAGLNGSYPVSSSAAPFSPPAPGSTSGPTTGSSACARGDGRAMRFPAVACSSRSRAPT